MFSGSLIGLGVLAFFLGSIPFALLAGKITGIDLRKQGSGNLGATNVFRVLGWKWGLFIFLLDGIKGYIPTFIALDMSDDPLIHILIGFLAILGHSLSPFVKFKGGKGAATGLGVIAALSPNVFGIVFAIAVILIGLFRYVAPVTILCSVITPILQYYLGYPEEYAVVTAFIAIFIIIRHKDNIRRLLRGEENQI